jgi:hypothetical protein
MTGTPRASRRIPRWGCVWCIAALLPSALLVAQTGMSRSARDGAALRIAFISDTQAPLPLETLYMGGRNNAEATALLFESILADSGLAAVVHLGDITAIGAWPPAWRMFDAFRNRCATRGLALAAAPGNHEYMLFPSPGIKQFRRRFPTGDRPALLRVGALAVILLNSNHDQLGDSAWDAQLARYRATLDSCERRPDIRAVIVACHHAPYTRSADVRPSAPVRDAILPPLLAARKTVALVTGHAHTAELFRVGGKRCIVIGGGGGPLHDYRRGAGQGEDLFPLPRSERSFHYLVCTLTAEGIRCTIRMLDPRGGERIRDVALP